MKNSITTFVCAMALSITFTFANSIEDKTKVAPQNTLPAAAQTIETPAPQREKTENQYSKYSPAQKAAIVELKVAK